MVKMKQSHRAIAKIVALGGIFSVALPALLPLDIAHTDVAAPTAKTTRQKITPAEREAARAKMETARAERTETALRSTLTRSGADAATQDAVVSYAKSEMTARADLSKAKANVMQALRTGAVTDSQLGVLLNEMRSSAEQEKTRRTRSAAALDAKIGYTKKPRLEAVLVLTGLVGDEAAILSPMMLAMNSMGRGRGRRAGANTEGKTPRVRKPRKTADANGAAPVAKDAPAAMPAP